MIVTKFVLFLGFNILIDMLKLVKTPSIFYSNSTITFLPIIYLVSFNQGRSGGRYPCVPPRPPLEPEAGSNILNLQNIHSDFFIFLSINNVTICPFYDNFLNSFLQHHLIYNVFFRGFHLKFISVSQSKMFDGDFYQALYNAVSSVIQSQI